MERRRRGQGPFQRRRKRAPRIGGRHALFSESLDYSSKEEYQAERGDVGTDRRNLVPAVERQRIIDGAPGHAGEAKEVLREEDDVRSDEHQPEVQLGDRLVVHVAAYLREPKIPAAENSEHRGDTHDVMEVSDDVIT